MKFDESTVESAALAWLAELGIPGIHGDAIAPGEQQAERDNFDQVVLRGRLRAALERLNPHIPAAARSGAVDEAIRRIERTDSQSTLHNHAAFHRLLVEGVTIEYRDGSHLRPAIVRLADFEHPAANDWLAVQQFAITGFNARAAARTHRRPDIVVFLNGLPVVVFEFKNAADERATIGQAFNQLRTYYDEIGSVHLRRAARHFRRHAGAAGGARRGLGAFQAVARSGGSAAPGAADADRGGARARPPARPDPLVLGLRARRRPGDQEGGCLSPGAGGQQGGRAHGRGGGGGRRPKVGVVWHHAGQRQEPVELFYAGKITVHPAMANPTLVILTDRNDLDDQLFGTFAAGQDVLRQTPVQAESRDHLRSLLQVASGGVIFTTIQKFQPDGPGATYPLLSERRNIVFIADEAHRSQYGFDAHLVEQADAAYLSYGFAKYVRDALPNASFIGFTGTPVESSDVSTRRVFGDTIDIYDIHRAVEMANVPIYYERAGAAELREDHGRRSTRFRGVTRAKRTRRGIAQDEVSQLEAMSAPKNGCARRRRSVALRERQRAQDVKAMIVC